MFSEFLSRALKPCGDRPNNEATEWRSCALISARLFQAERKRMTGDHQMKRLALTFLSTAAVCAVLSATPAAAQDTVTGAPAGTTPVTVEGYGSGATGAPEGAAPVTVEGYGNPFGHIGAPAASNADPTNATEPPEQCPVFRDFNDAEAKDAVICSPD
jgi:hypothetical protein